jgi:hypothetical protein
LDLGSGPSRFLASAISATRAFTFPLWSRLNLGQAFGFSPNISDLCSGVLNLRRVQFIEAVEKLLKIVCSRVHFIVAGSDFGQL